uniref:Coiled-coil domain-containing protein n=1 Tax=Panagrellus redivivus TaxID=6233 RepID=A0A7E4VEU5_PANRE
MSMSSICIKGMILITILILASVCDAADLCWFFVISIVGRLVLVYVVKLVDLVVNTTTGSTVSSDRSSTEIMQKLLQELQVLEEEKREIKAKLDDQEQATAFYMEVMDFYEKVRVPQLRSQIFIHKAENARLREVSGHSEPLLRFTSPITQDALLERLHNSRAASSNSDNTANSDLHDSSNDTFSQ